MQVEMNEFLHIRQANDYAIDVGAAVWHPMVSVIHFDELGEIRYSLNKLEVYAIFVQDNFPSGSTYGMGGYNTSKGRSQLHRRGRLLAKPTTDIVKCIMGGHSFSTLNSCEAQSLRNDLPTITFSPTT